MRLLILSASVLLANSQVFPANNDSKNHPSHNMDTIVVTASAQKENVHEVLASINVIDGEQLNQRYVNDLSDALDDQAGIQNIGVGLNRKGISIRGMDPTHTLYLVDGQRINSSTSAISHSDGELNWIPTEAIQQIEVVRGPMSSLYGSEALGGVVNIITKKPTTEWMGSLSLQAMMNESDQGGDQYKSSTYLAGPLIRDKLGINIWAEHRQRSMLIDPTNEQLAKQDEQKNNKAHIGLFWQATQQQTVDLIVEHGVEDREDLRGGTRNLYYQVNDEIERTRYGMKHQGNWDWGKSILQIYQSEFERKSQRSDGGDVTSPQKLSDQTASAQLQWNLAAHDFVLGQEFRKETLKDPTVNKKQEDSTHHYGIYLQDLWQVNDAMKIGFGLRGDDHQEFGWELSPKLSALYQFNDAWSFKAGVGKGYKAPTLKQLSTEFESHSAMGGRGVIRGNPDLQPETNTAYEMSMHFHHQNLETSLGWFRNNIDDLIETQRQASCSFVGKVCLDYVNVAKAEIQGLEWSATYQIEPALHLEANYTYLDTKNRTNNSPLVDRAKYQINTSIIWDIYDRLQTKLRQQYRSQQFQGTGVEDTKSYNLWHVYANYQLKPQLTLFTGIENFTDKKIGFNANQQHSFSDAGRRYFAGLNMSF